MRRQTTLLHCTVLAACASFALAQSTPVPRKTPVPAPITSAKTVFLANGGSDTVATKAFTQDGDPELAYHEFYAAMQDWKHYQLTTSPMDADLVIELSTSAPVTVGNFYDPHLTVRIFDRPSHVLVWSFEEPLDPAFRKATFNKNVTKAVTSAIETLKTLTAP